MPALFAKINMTGEGCWPWTAHKDKDGYGRFNVNGVPEKASRCVVALVADVTGRLVAHKCDNPACCRLSHLFCSDHQGNMADMLAKGRSNKLPPGAVAEIVATRGEDRRLAVKYGVALGAIRNVRLRERRILR